MDAIKIVVLSSETEEIKVGFNLAKVGQPKLHRKEQKD